jgi:hypothetical protein
VKSKKRIYIPLNIFDLVSGCDATHCNKANALQTRLLACGDNVGGESIGYILIISCNNTAIVPNEYHNTGAKSGYASLLLLSSINAFSLYFIYK